MITGLYSAATAMDRATQRHELISQNLANIDMPGYRRVLLPQQTFESSLSDAQQRQAAFDSLGTTSTGPVVDFTSGALQNTESTLDFAISGEGFFVIEGPDGPLYSRNGAFRLDADGRLVTVDGLPVAGESGNIVLPQGSTAAQLSVAVDGTATVNGVSIGRIKTVRFKEPHTLLPSGVTLFRAPQDTIPEPADAAILQGTRERSNVHPVQELVDLIAATRAHEAAQRAMNTITEAIQRHTNL